MELMKNFCDTFERKQIEEVSMVARIIWLRMNGFVFNADFNDPRCCIQNKYSRR